MNLDLERLRLSFGFLDEGIKIEIAIRRAAAKRAAGSYSSRKWCPVDSADARKSRKYPYAKSVIFLANLTEENALPSARPIHASSFFLMTIAESVTATITYIAAEKTMANKRLAGTDKEPERTGPGEYAPRLGSA